MGDQATLAETQSCAPLPWRTSAIAVAVFAALSVAAGLSSEGFLEGDACTHYLYARFAFDEPHLMTNVWGRPFCTIIYALPAVLARREGVRIFSMVLAVVAGLITARVAARQGYRRPELALIFLLGQPLVFLHSFSELTELPFVLLMAGAMLAYQRRNWLLLAAVAGLMPTARPEGFVMLAAVAVALLLHGAWYWLPVLAAPLAIWSYAGWYLTGPYSYPWYRWLPEQWPYSQTSSYQGGHLLHFVASMPAVISPLVFPALVAGIVLSFRAGNGAHAAGGSLLLRAWRALFGEDHRRRCQLLIALLALGVLAGHSFLYWRRMWSSNGELRYMLVVAPMWAMLAAKGWEWCFQRTTWRRPAMWAGLAVLFPVVINLVYRVVPVNLTFESRRARDMARWYAAQCPWRNSYSRLMAPDREIYYHLDLSPSNWDRSAEYYPPTIEKDHKGIILIWDSCYGVANADPSRQITAAMVKAAGWVPVLVQTGDAALNSRASVLERLTRVRFQPRDFVVFLSPKDDAGRPTPRDIEVPLPPWLQARE